MLNIELRMQKLNRLELRYWNVYDFQSILIGMYDLD